jgi:hypothetical protein
MSAPTVDDLTPSEKELIRHARAMNGWLTASYFTVAHAAELEHLGPAVFEHVTTGGPERYYLTTAGLALAEELAR